MTDKESNNDFIAPLSFNDNHTNNIFSIFNYVFSNEDEKLKKAIQTNMEHNNAKLLQTPFDIKYFPSRAKRFIKNHVFNNQYTNKKLDLLGLLSLMNKTNLIEDIIQHDNFELIDYRNRELSNYSVIFSCFLYDNDELIVDFFKNDDKSILAQTLDDCLSWDDKIEKLISDQNYSNKCMSRIIELKQDFCNKNKILDISYYNLIKACFIKQDKDNLQHIVNTGQADEDVLAWCQKMKKTSEKNCTLFFDNLDEAGYDKIGKLWLYLFHEENNFDESIIKKSFYNNQSLQKQALPLLKNQYLKPEINDKTYKKMEFLYENNGSVSQNSVMNYCSELLDSTLDDIPQINQLILILDLNFQNQPDLLPEIDKQTNFVAKLKKKNKKTKSYARQLEQQLLKNQVNQTKPTNHSPAPKRKQFL